MLLVSFETHVLNSEMGEMASGTPSGFKALKHMKPKYKDDDDHGEDAKGFVFGPLSLLFQGIKLAMRRRRTRTLFSPSLW